MVDRMGSEEKESELQDRILESPSLLPGFDGPVAAAKELPARRAGSADVVVVNAEGQIAIVECKRAVNPELRRWVIGQLFEYAAALWKLDYADLERVLAARGTALTEPFEDVPGWDEKTFRRAVDKNLKTGDFRLFIAVEKMTKQLEKRFNRTVTLINSRLRDEVQFLAVAVPRGGRRGKPYGKNPKAIARLKPKLKPDRWTLIEDISSEEAACAAKGLLDWAEGKDLTVRYTRRKQDGIETGTILTPGGHRLFRIKEHRVVRVSFDALRHQHWDEERISRLVQDLARIDERFQVDTKSKGARPEAPLESLAKESNREDFLTLMKQVLAG